MKFMPEVSDYRVTLFDTQQKAHKKMREEHSLAIKRGHKVTTHLLRCISDTRGLSFGVLTERIA